MEAETALVGTQGRVELDAEAAVDLELALVILPDDTELDEALGNGGDLQGGPVLRVLLEKGRALEGRGKLWRNGMVSGRARGGG